jgi:predicted ATP-grasp superfamily ATP-dependent carboligase
VIQELVPDAEAKIFSLFTYIGCAGTPLASVVGRKVRQGPIRFGTSAVFEVRHDERVLELGLRLLRSSSYRGFAQVEFAHDARDDTFRLLEVNTRLPMWAGIAIRPEFDIARLAYDDLCGRPVEPLGTLTEPVSWVYFAKDAWVSLQLARRRELRLGELVSPYARRKKSRSVLALDDLRPALASVGYLRSKARRGPAPPVSASPPPSPTRAEPPSAGTA